MINKSIPYILLLLCCLYFVNAANESNLIFNISNSTETAINESNFNITEQSGLNDVKLFNNTQEQTNNRTYPKILKDFPKLMNFTIASPNIPFNEKFEIKTYLIIVPVIIIFVSFLLFFFKFGFSLLFGSFMAWFLGLKLCEYLGADLSEFSDVISLVYLILIVLFIFFYLLKLFYFAIQKQQWNE